MDPTERSEEESSQAQDVTLSPVRGRPRSRGAAAPRAKAKEAKVKTAGEPKVAKPRTRKAPEEGAPNAS